MWLCKYCESVNSPIQTSCCVCNRPKDYIEAKHMYCNNCGTRHDVNESTVYCINCGEKLYKRVIFKL